VATRGASLVEYIILIGVVALLAITAWRRFADAVTTVTDRHAEKVRTLEATEVNPVTGQPGVLAATDPQGGSTVPGPGGVSGLSDDDPLRSALSDESAAAPRASASAGSKSAAAAKLIADVLNVMCPKDKAFLADLKARGVTVTAFDKIYFDDPYFDGTKWTTKRFDAGGTTLGTKINMIRSTSAAENAATIFHEGVHTGQPSSMAWRDKEYDAYVKEDQWRISHGLPPHTSSFRTVDAAGNPVTDVAAVRAFVDREYPGVTSTTASGPPEQVIGKSSSGNTMVQRADGSVYERAPKAGDSYGGPEKTVPAGGIPIDMSKLQCP
jgi:Flp pilus assembly pilin Flp